MASQRSSTATRRHPLRSIGRAGRVVAVVTLSFGWLLSAVPVGAQAADGLDGDTYTSTEFGWSVEFDDRVWEAEEVDNPASQGVTLSGEETFGSLVVYDDGIEDAGDCLDDLDRAFTTSDDWDGLAPARRLDAPETVADAEAELYTGTLALDEGEIDLVLYLECREVNAATLSITLTAIEETYEDSLPDLTELLAGIDTGGASTDDPDDGPSANDPVDRGDDGDPTPEEDDPTPDADDPTPDADLTPENDPPVLDHEPADQVGARDDATLDDGSYSSDVGYRLTWDADLYQGETGDDPGTGVLLENAESGATLEVAAFEDAEIEDCIDAEVQRILESPDYLSAARSNGVRPPTSSDEAVGRMLRATEDTTQQQRKIIYVECRPLLDEGEEGDPVFLVVRAVSDDEDFRVSRTQFEAILAAIAIGDEAAEPTAEPTARATRQPTEEPEAEPTRRPRRTPTAEPDDGPSTRDLGETDIAGGVFVGQRVPFKVEWDTAYWDVEEVEDQGLEGVRFTAETGAFGSILSANTPAGYDMEDCLSGFNESWAGLTPDLSEIEPAADAQLALPEGSESVYGVGTFTAESGNTATLIHGGGCLELDGGGFLIVQMQIFEPVYAENLAAFNEVLGSIVFGSGDQVGAVSAMAPSAVRGVTDRSAAHRDILRPS